MNKVMAGGTPANPATLVVGDPACGTLAFGVSYAEAVRRRAAVLGVVAGLATVAIAEAVKPRGGTSLLLDWDQVRRTARARLADPTTSPAALAAATKGYRSLAAKLEKPLLDFVGGMPAG